MPRYFLSVAAGRCHFANAGPGIGWGGLCLVLLLLLCPNTADAQQLTLFVSLVENNLPQETETLDRPDGVGLFSGTQSQEIQAYCDALNIADYNCRRISRIFFAKAERAKTFPRFVPAELVWDSNHMTGNFDRGWEDDTMVASSRVGQGNNYYCMSLFFDPPIPQGWDMEFRWTVGGTGNSSSFDGIGVDVKFNQGTNMDSRDIAPARGPRPTFRTPRLRDNGGSEGTALPWETLGGFSEFRSSTVSEVRWCVFTVNALPISSSLARIDGVLFGTGREDFCRPELNAGDNRCASEHNDFIGRYCTALDLPSQICQRVSRLAFTRSGIGEHIWDPTHSEASAGGGSSSVLSPPVKVGEYSCMSLYLDRPSPQGVEFHFAWDLGRRVAFSDDLGREDAFMRFFFFAAGAGAGHNPADSATRGGDGSYRLGAIRESGFAGWRGRTIQNPATDAGELKWCYYGGNTEVGERDRGRVDFLQVSEEVSDSIDSRMEIGKYCTALNIEDALCARVSSIVFRRSQAAQTAWDPDHAGGALLSDMLSVASQQVGDEEYSCMSLHFSEDPIARGSGISFRWSLGRGIGIGSSSFLQVWFAPAEPPPSMVDVRRPFIRQSNPGLSAWRVYWEAAIDREIPEIRWCYFGGTSFGVGRNDIGRIDRLVLVETKASLTLARPFEARLFSGTQSPEIQAYCDGLNIADYNCRRISKILFTTSERVGGSGPDVAWDNNAQGDYDENRWDDTRMVASPVVPPGDSYYCMSLFFDPPIPSGWDMQFRWTVGNGSGTGNTSVDVQFGPGTSARDDITRTDVSGQFRANAAGGSHFLSWATPELSNFGSGGPVPEVRWCMFATDIEAHSNNQARIDGILFGPSGGEEFCRPELNVDDNSCVPGHDEFIDRYCTALDLPPEICGLVSRLAFSRTGIGDPVWDPTHRAASSGGGSSSVLSPPVKLGEYSCMSLYLDPPNAQGREFSFVWDLSRRRDLRAADSGRTPANIRFFYFASGAGAGHNPADLSVRSPDAVYTLAVPGSGGRSGYAGWRDRTISNPATEAEELKWCYYGGDPHIAAASGRGRVDRLQLVEAAAFLSRDSRPDIEGYCTAMNIEDALCTRVSSVTFQRVNTEGELVWKPTHAVGAAPRDMLSVITPAVLVDDISCISLRFSEDPIARGSDISFQWALGRLSNEGRIRIQFETPTSVFQLPVSDNSLPGLSSSERQITPWATGSVRAIDRAAPELRWCYIESGRVQGVANFGRIDQLVVDEGIALSFVLPNPGPAIAEGTNAAVFVRSAVAVANGSRVMIRLLVEEGERFIDRDGPNVVAEESTLGRLVLELPLTGDGNALEHALTLPTQIDNRPNPTGIIRLALLDPPTAGYRLGTPSSGYLIAIEGDRGLLPEYCAALNMQAFCDRLAGIVFAEDRLGERAWISDYPEGALPGDDLSVASPIVRSGRYSCMSLHFREPILAGSDISFQWAAGLGSGSRSSRLLVWFAPTEDQPPTMLSGQPDIIQDEAGFSDWKQHSEVALDRPVPEIRWCYFGGSQRPGDMDIGRIDRLEVRDGSRIGFVLPDPNPGPAVLEGTAVAIVVRSEVAVEAGRSVLIRLLVEEGERVIDPNGPNVVAEESTPGRLVLGLPLTGDGTTLEHALRLSIRDDNRLATASTIRLSLLAPAPGARYQVGTPSSGYLITVRDNGRLMREYCTALNIQAALCDRVSGIVFVESGSGERVWTPDHPEGAVPGDDRSVASPIVGAGDYSCMSLRFSDPLAFGSDISFQWSLGRGAGGGSSSSMLVWFAPTAEQLPMLALGQPGISQEQEGFSAWMKHSAVAIDRPVPEIRWCYFGSDSSPGEMDIGRVDRLAVSEGIAISFALPEPNPGPAVVEGATVSIVVRSVVALEAGRTVSIRLLVEEGSRFLDPNGPNVVAEESTPGRLVVELPLTGDGTALEHALMLPTQDGNRSEPGGNIRLALVEPLPTAGYRVSTPSSGYLIAVKDNRLQIMNHCEALNMPPALCDRVSDIVFVENGSGERAWISDHPEGAVPGDDRSAASPRVGAGDYSCLSLHFSEPILAGSDISFQWSAGRGAGGGSSSLLVWFAPTGADQPPMRALGQPRILHGQEGFSVWVEHSAVAIDRPVPEIRWCYFGVNPSPGEMDIGRVDRLAVSEGIALSFALPNPNPGPAIVEGMTVSVVVRSVVALEAGRTVSIRLLVEEGERFIDRGGPNVVAEESTSGRLVVELPLTGDGTALEHALMLPTQDDNRPEPRGNIRLALAEPPSEAGYRVSTPSSGYLIAVKDNRRLTMEYCAALNMPAALCDRVSEIVFVENGSGKRIWTSDHPEGAVPGDNRSMASPSVGAGDYSCLSLHFSDPLAFGSNISFQWSLGRGAGGGDSSSSLLVWFAPTGADQLPMLALGPPRILQEQDGFSAWMEHSAVAIDRPVPEIRWCYFGGNPSPDEMDIGRVDRLAVSEGIALSFALPEPNPGPAIVEGATVSVVVRSVIALEAGRSVLVRLLVEEGERFIDPTISQVVVDLAMPGRLILEYSLTGDGTTLEHVLMLPTQDDNRPESRGNIRLALAEPLPTAGYRVSTPSSGYLIAVKDNRRLTMEYCAALNMPTALCDRVSDIVFVENGSGKRIWISDHPEGAVPGDDLSMASPSVGAGDYSCMSLHFSDPIAFGSNISFQWSAGRGAGGGDSSSTMLVWFAPTADGQPPMQDLGQPSISQGQAGFSVWMEHSAVAIDRPVPEIRWCYFGGNPSPDEMDIGRVDRLAVSEGIALSFALPEPNPGPAIVEGTTVSVVVRSVVALEAGRSVLVRLLVEEGERFIDPTISQVVVDLAMPGRLVLEYSLTGDGTTLEHVLMLPTQDDNRPEQGGNIRLALAEPPSEAGYRVSTPSSGYLIAVKDNRRLTMEYCAALNMPAALCDRVSDIVFMENGSGKRVWISDHPEGAVPGDDRSMASPSVGAGDYSCLSLRFSDPLAFGSDISFRWSLGRGGGGDTNSSTLLVWLAPTGADQLPVLTLGPPRILQEQDGFSAWIEHSAVAIDRSVPEIRWCYFGGNPSPDEMDIGRVDRLAVSEGIALSFALPEPNPGPAIVEGATVSVVVRSVVALEAGRSVSIRLLVEEGERFIDPAISQVVVDLAMPGRLVLEYSLTGDGTTLEHVLMLPTQDDNRPEQGDNIRLALAEPPSEAGYRLGTPSSGYLIAVKDNRRLTMEYCAALNMPPALCDRVSDIVFVENGSGERVWTSDHPEGVVPGDDRSVASPRVGAGDYSCMSLHFSDPIAFGSNISFRWSLGRGAGGGDSSSSLLVWFAPTGADQLPMLALGPPRILQEQDGFSAWMEHSAVAIDRPVPEIRWCYFGVNPSPGEMDIGRVDRLEVVEGNRIRFVLPEPNPGPAIVEGTTALVLVRSTVALADGDSVLIRLLVEEGSRFLDPNGPNVVAEESTPGRLVLEYSLTGDGTALEHVLMLPTQDDNRPEQGGNIRLALAEAQPGVGGYRVSTPSSGYLIAVKDSRRQIMDYCAALNMPAALCDRVSGIVFVENGSRGRVWISDHPEGAVLGDSLSVASPSVGEGDYSCLSLHFSEPIIRGSDISFRWSLGRGAGGGSSSLLVWFAPTGADQPPMRALGQPRILHGQEGFSVWVEHSAVAIDRPVPEIRWCYFGTNPSPGEMDIGRVDRLAVSEGIAFSFVLPEPNPGPAIVEGATVSVVVRSVVALEAGRSVMIRLLAEEGSLFLDPNGPNVVAEISTPGRLIFEYPLTGDGSTLEHVLILQTLDDDLSVPGGKVRLALAEPPPEAGYRLGTPSSGYLIAVKDNDYRPNAEGLVRWWQLLRRCEELGSGCPDPSESVPTLPDSPGLPMRTEDELGNISAAFQALLADEALDVNGDEMNDTMDLRIILRYLAGLRGGALGESGTVNEARLQELTR